MNSNPIRVAAAALTACLFMPNAFAATVYWTNWTSDTTGTTTGKAAGTITTPTATINVNYSGEVTSQTVINGTYPSWGPSTTYADGVVVADAPTFHDLIAQNGGSGTGTNTITFSQPVTNLVMAIWSLGSGGDNANYTFSQPFSIVAGGPSNEYGGSTITTFGPDGITGNEGNGTIVFSGTFSSLTFTNTNFESYYGFTLGVDGPATVPLPAAAWLLISGLGFLGVIGRKSRAA